MIRDELFAAKRKGLNVIVSMSDIAASGGVYIQPQPIIFLPNLQLLQDLLRQLPYQH